MGCLKTGLISNDRLDLAILSQEPRATSNSGLGYTGSPPGPHRPSQPLLPGAGETSQPDRKRARRPARARRGGGALLLAALAAIIAVSLPLQGHAQTSVPHDWSLKPSGLDTRDKFRLLFVSSTKRNANPTAIATYNTFVQTRAAAGHTDIQAYSAGFKVIGCTATVDAIDNTGTTGTGVPIYWLDGDKVADDYADFYDGSWDSSSPTSETGASVTTTSTDGVITGCNAIGTAGGFTLGDGLSASMGNPSGRNNVLSGAISPLANSRRLYGLSVVFEVSASTDATLSALVVNDGTNDRTLDPTFVPGTFDYDADVGNAVTTVTLTATVNNSNASVTGVTLDGTAIADTDFSDGITVPSLAEDDNEIVVTVTPESGATKTYTITVTRARRRTTTPTPPGEVEVPNGWSLIPSGLAAGDKFRLLFLSSTNTDGTSYDIADYNTFVQGRAAAGHTDIQAYSSAFRAVGCTSDSDATANTGAYNSAGTGVPIHWLNGNKVADDYPDFYDGSWDDEANDKNEFGDNGPDTSQTANFPLTGCQDYGEEAVLGGRTLALGQPTPRVGRPNSSATGSGPIHSLSFVGPSDLRPMYGLSQVFKVGASTDATLSDLDLAENDGTAITLSPTFAPATTSYTAAVANTVDEITIAPTVNDSNAEYEIQDSGGTALTDADSNTTGFQVALSEGANTIKVEVTAEDDSTPETYTVVVTRELMTTTPTALALSIEDASAAENAGYLLFDVTLSRSLPNTVKVDFETISGGTATEGEDYHARRTYTHVIPPRETTVQMGFALIEDTIGDAGETVKVRLSNARVVDAYGDKIKDLDITTAEATGTITAPATTTTNVPNLNIRIQDATGDEDDGWLVFRVRLSRKYDDYVCYDFETISGGTATEGRDYSKRPKVGQWVQIGKRVDKPFVRIIDDSVNDDGETVKVKISNARLCDDAFQTVEITRAEATGTIRNTDSMPLAWMVRFGRTVGGQVVDALNGRLEGGGETKITVGGVSLTGGGTLEEEEPVRKLGLPEWTDRNRLDEATRSMTTEELIMGSTFHLSTGERQPGRPAFTAWGRVATGGFEAEENDVTMDGDVTTGLLGADAEWNRLLAGIMVSQSSGDGSYRLDSGSSEQAGDQGTVESSMTGVYPYARLDLNERVSAWGLVGIGSGELTLHQEGQNPMETDLGMRMGALGVKGQVLDGSGPSGIGINVKSDVMWVRTSSARTQGMMGAEGDVSRLRLILEANRQFAIEGGGTFVPSGEVGLRVDGGDAETGTGLEVGAGMRYARGPITIEGQVRALVAHEASGYEEWGASGAIHVNPSQSGRGLTIAIAPVWGSAGSQAERLWGARDARELGQEAEFEAEARLEAELGYGMSLPQTRGVVTPYTGLSLGEGTRTNRVGTRWNLAPGAVLGLEATRQGGANGAAGTNAIEFRTQLRW